MIGRGNADGPGVIIRCVLENKASEPVKWSTVAAVANSGLRSKFMSINPLLEQCACPFGKAKASKAIADQEVENHNHV